MLSRQIVFTMTWTELENTTTFGTDRENLPAPPLWSYNPSSSTQVQAELGAVREKAKQETEAALTLKVREKEEQIASMQRQIEDLRRKAEQGSQQLQGEVQELALEGLLRQKFPRDVFDPVPKGEFGGDLIQHVVGPAGQICGSMLWEAKRTKNWSDGWLGKLREDQHAAKADVALIVSHARPTQWQELRPA